MTSNICLQSVDAVLACNGTRSLISTVPQCPRKLALHRRDARNILQVRSLDSFVIQSVSPSLPATLFSPG